MNWARELLVALARRTGGWIGWEPCTLRSLAEELAFVDLGRSGRRVAGDVELAALVDQALDEAIAARAVSPGFVSLAGGLGFRQAVRDTVNELRVAGIGAERVRRAAPEGTPARDTAAVLERYERLLDAAGLADSAALFELALAAFDREAPFVLGEVIAIAPDLRVAGLPGQLAERLLDHGARPLAADPAFGTPAPAHGLDEVARRRGIASWPAGSGESTAHSALSYIGEPSALVDGDAAAAVDPIAVEVDLFAAATPSDEIREVLRRTVDEGRRLDEVEIATTDPDAYGIALDAVCQHLGLAHTSLRGIPLARTRIGRALERWLTWIGDGLPADTIREGLEAGDLAAPDSEVSSTQLARLFRKLGVGWGRERYAAALTRLRDPAFAEGTRRRDGEDDERWRERVAARARDAAGLAALLDRLLAVTPPVPERGSDAAVSASAAELARATLGWLDLVPTHGMAEDHAMGRLRSRLEQLAAAPTGHVGFSTALAQLHDALADLRVWSSQLRKPWASAGGMPHLTDIVHAGTTGRPRVFVVGLDADRVVGPRVQNPMLGDATRGATGSDLPTTSDHRAERAWHLARALARLRGRVTLSYALAGESGDRPAGPAHVLLQALRVLQRKPALTYDDLRSHLGAPVCAVPATAAHALDGREAWLAALASGPLLLNGDEAVRRAHALLDGGLAAEAARSDEAPSAFHGVLPTAAGLYDPRTTGRAISPTSLELLGRCPLAWFYRYGLGIDPPDDPEYDPEAWLDAMDRGSLLHELYESFGRAYQHRRGELADPAAEARILAIADEVLARWRDRVPPPSEAVFVTERDEIRQAAIAFLTHEREAAANRDSGEWLGFEVAFDSDQPARLPLGDGELRLKGKIDRVDRLPDGRLVVIDYKTGSPGSYKQRKDDGPFKGGRRIQAAAYAAAAAERFGAPVARFEYRFPTARGQNEIVTYDPAQIAQAEPIVRGLLDHIARGLFVPTNDSSDCRYCDYRPICRVTVGEYETISGRAEWAAARADDEEAYASMIARRAPGGGA